MSTTSKALFRILLELKEAIWRGKSTVKLDPFCLVRRENFTNVTTLMLYAVEISLNVSKSHLVRFLDQSFSGDIMASNILTKS